MGLTLEGSGLAVDLDSDPFGHLDAGNGWGPPPVALQWHDGAGHGSLLRGGRALRRPLTVPLLIQGPDAAVVDDRLNRLYRILAPGAEALFRRTVGAETWALTVARESGGDWEWGTATNGDTWVVTSPVLVAGDPAWQRERAEAVPIVPADATQGLLDPYSMSELRLAASQAFGTVTLDNPGSAESPLVAVINGPATHVEVTGPGGEFLDWTGVLAAGEWIRLERGRATDHTGANRYHELGSAPQFWDVRPGVQAATVLLTGAGAASSVVLTWQPRKWVQFA